MPGILDDYLPDNWGRRVLAQIGFYRDRRKLNQNICIDTLSELGDCRVGAIQWVEKEESPKYELGCHLDKIKEAENAA